MGEDVTPNEIIHSVCALTYIMNYTLKEVTIKNSSKAEATKIFNYPYTAIEEILSNAVYHRSYQINEPITVRITSESIEITSFPGFDRSISDESIEKYQIRSRIYRNRRIGDFLKELKLIEGRNTGFPNAIQALKSNGSELPKFEMNPERDYLSVIIPIHKYFIPKSKKTDKALAYQTKIKDILNIQPLSLSELAIAMGYKGITARLSRTVNEMLLSGTLKKVTVDGYGVKLSV